MSKRGPLSNENAQGVLRKQAKDARLLAQKNFRDVLGTPAGRSVLAALIYEAGGINEQSFSTEPLAMAFNEGRRAVALDLLRWCWDADGRSTRQMISDYMDTQAAESDVRVRANEQPAGEDDGRSSDNDRVGGTSADD